MAPRVRADRTQPPTDAQALVTRWLCRGRWQSAAASQVDRLETVQGVVPYPEDCVSYPGGGGVESNLDRAGSPDCELHSGAHARTGSGDAEFGGILPVMLAPVKARLTLPVFVMVSVSYSTVPTSVFSKWTPSVPELSVTPGRRRWCRHRCLPPSAESECRWCCRQPRRWWNGRHRPKVRRRRRTGTFVAARRRTGRHW